MFSPLFTSSHSKQLLVCLEGDFFWTVKTLGVKKKDLLNILKKKKKSALVISP